MLSSIYFNMERRHVLPILTLTLLALHHLPAAAALTAAEVASPINNIVCIIFWVFVVVAGALAALIFVVSGVMYIISEGEPEKRKKSRDAMIHALIGIIIISITAVIVTSLAQALFTNASLPIQCTRAGLT